MRAGRVVVVLLLVGVAGAAEPSAQAGRNLFTGARPFQNGGAPCGACHGLGGEGVAFTASLGPELSSGLATMDPAALDGLLEALPFPSMMPVYEGRALTPAERADLVPPTSSPPPGRARRATPGTSRPAASAGRPSSSSSAWRWPGAAARRRPAPACWPAPHVSREVRHELGEGHLDPDERRWEEIYRNRFQHDKLVRSTHGVNCTGGCSWNIHVKNGVVALETQATDYPRISCDVPAYEPRGCQRGISTSWYLYSPLRVKYPYLRGALLDR